MYVMISRCMVWLGGEITTSSRKGRLYLCHIFVPKDVQGKLRLLSALPMIGILRMDALETHLKGRLMTARVGPPSTPTPPNKFTKSKFPVLTYLMEGEEAPEQGP